MSLRTFIAFDIYPDENFLNAIEYIKDHFRFEHIRWVPVKPLHVTLAFTGNISESVAGLVSGNLRKRLTGSSSFRIRIVGTGFFGPVMSPKVIWAGISPCNELTWLHGVIARAIGDAGLKPDTRPFRPHITLGRVKDYSGTGNFDRLAPEIRGGLLMEAVVTEVIFYRSILGGDGARYEPLDKFPLSG